MSDEPKQDAASGAVFAADPRLPRRALLLGAACLLTVGGAHALKPTKLVAAQGPAVKLEDHVPEAFGHWRIDRAVMPLQPAPDVVAKIEAIYDATLARTYISDQGERVMLSIAYGGDQSGRLRVHRPEACYSAQGFHVKQARVEALPLAPTLQVEVRRLVARLGPRPEPITYWIRVGKSTVAGNTGQRLEQLRHAINGEIPDGLIFRVSSIDNDAEKAYRIHDQFVRELLSTVSPASRSLLAGA
jgi:EpsI family protein